MKRLLLCVALGACAPTTASPHEDGALDGLAVAAVNPDVLLPGSTIVVAGRGFVDADYGESALVLRGTLAGAALDVRLPARHAGGELLATWNQAGQGELIGEAFVEVVSRLDGETYASPPIAVSLEVRRELSPSLTEVASGVIFINDRVVASGADFLLGGDEGQTLARLSGCYAEDGGPCLPVAAIELPASPDQRFDRSQVAFAFAPEVAGIRPGHFEGEVVLVNRHKDGVVQESQPAAAFFDVVPPRIFQVSPAAASLGQFVDIEGGGFVGGAGLGEQVTTVELEGNFSLDGGGSQAVSLLLVPEFSSGRRVRYVVNEEDELGQRIDLRHATGRFVGTARPIVQAGPVTVVGDPVAVSLAIAPIKQVVHVAFQPSYVESLRHFGLRAADTAIRQRVFTVAARDYAGINVEFRAEPPEDFAYFAQVDLAGPDPNGLGLLGYDNSPGKDQGNTRLYDKIGGVNAQTQEDGFPGYGGVFVESFFGFSRHPNGFAVSLDGGASTLFDEVFDPLRPDRGGAPVRAEDLASLSVGECPASERAGQVACAVFVLGNMIGTTMSHEVGHSLGLANPSEAAAFHNAGDQPGRLMDAGGARTFAERAELQGEGPARFCDEDYAYLRAILPGVTEPAAVDRPGCF